MRRYDDDEDLREDYDDDEDGDDEVTSSRQPAGEDAFDEYAMMAQMVDMMFEDSISGDGSW